MAIRARPDCSHPRSTLLSGFAKPIGPPDPWLPPLLDLLKVIPFDRREWLERVGCVIHSFDQVRHIQQLVMPYTIASITPNSACPNQTVTINGSGFGSQPQTVRFPTIGGSAEGQIASWSDGQIQVVVPAGATCGDIVLVIPAGQVTSCGNPAIDVTKPGSGTPYFDGGIPHIHRFAGNAREAWLRVDPSSTIEFTWKVCPSTAAVRLTVTARETGAVLEDQVGLAADARLSVAVPAFTSRRTLDCVLEVSGPCQPSPARKTLVVDVLPKPNVRIEGTEVTQGIQRFWRQGITPNSVSTVAGKDTIVRVYVSADMGGFNNDEVPGIYGVLSVGTYDLYPINGITPTNPSGALPSHTARKVTAINRNNVNHTINFRIPAALCWGTKSLFCYLIVPGPGGTVDPRVRHRPIRFGGTLDRTDGALVPRMGGAQDLRGTDLPGGLDQP
jgi:IPT/TIG domain